MPISGDQMVSRLIFTVESHPYPFPNSGSGPVHPATLANPFRWGLTISAYPLSDWSELNKNWNKSNKFCFYLIYIGDSGFPSDTPKDAWTFPKRLFQNFRIWFDPFLPARLKSTFSKRYWTWQVDPGLPFSLWNSIPQCCGDTRAPVFACWRVPA